MRTCKLCKRTLSDTKFYIVRYSNSYSKAIRRYVCMECYKKRQNEKNAKKRLEEGKVIKVRMGAKQRVYNYIKDFGYITTKDAFVDLGITRLSEYIRQLRQEYPIADEIVFATNRYGEKVWYKKYFFGEKKDESCIS